MLGWHDLQLLCFAAGHSLLLLIAVLQNLQLK
jgi:hypothetical protein